MGIGLGLAQRVPIPNVLCQTSPMRKLTATLCLTLAMLVESVSLPFAASVADNGKASGYFTKAEQYTVKIWTRVKYPPLKNRSIRRTTVANRTHPEPNNPPRGLPLL